MSPTCLASNPPSQRPYPAGGGSSKAARMRRSCSSWYCLGLPLRDASRRPDKPACAKRPRHLLTVAGRAPTRSAAALLLSPSAMARITSARNAMRRSVFAAPSQPLKVARCSSVNITSAALITAGYHVRQFTQLDPLGDNEVHKTVKSRGNQPRLNKLVEILVKATPTRAESASCRNVFWQLKVERAQPGSEHASVGLREKYCDPPPQTGEFVALRTRDLGDQAFASQPAKIIGGLSRGIRRREEEGANALDQLMIGEAADQKTEAHQGRQDGHHTLVAKAKSWGIETIIGGRWSGHLTKGGHVGSGLRICRFGVTQTPVGGLANGPKGTPVLHADTAPDTEVIHIADNGFGTQGPSLFEILLDPRRLVVTAQGGIDTPGDDASTKCSGRARANPSTKDQRDLIRAADIQVIADHAFKPHPACRRPVEHVGVGNFELPKRHLIPVSSADIGLAKRRGQTPPPSPEEPLHVAGTKAVADPLQSGGIAATAKAVVQGLIGDAGFL